VLVLQRDVRGEAGDLGDVRLHRGAPSFVRHLAAHSPLPPPPASKFAPKMQLHAQFRTARGFCGAAEAAAARAEEERAAAEAAPNSLQSKLARKMQLHAQFRTARAFVSAEAARAMAMPFDERGLKLVTTRCPLSACDSHRPFDCPPIRTDPLTALRFARTRCWGAHGASSYHNRTQGWGGTHRYGRRARCGRASGGAGMRVCPHHPSAPHSLALYSTPIMPSIMHRQRR
jgi:hypothetical protein